MSDLLQEALSAEQRGDIALAKQLLSQALIQDPNNETAWMLMADAVDDVRLRRNCLERVLAINPHNFDASTALTKLNTSPLEPVTRGERDKPIIPPRFDKCTVYRPLPGAVIKRNILHWWPLPDCETASSTQIPHQRLIGHMIRTG
jgi:hypothetical protein